MFFPFFSSLSLWDVLLRPHGLSPFSGPSSSIPRRSEDVVNWRVSPFSRARHCNSFDKTSRMASLLGFWSRRGESEGDPQPQDSFDSFYIFPIVSRNQSERCGGCCLSFSPSNVERRRRHVWKAYARNWVTCKQNPQNWGGVVGTLSTKGCDSQTSKLILVGKCLCSK